MEDNPDEFTAQARQFAANGCYSKAFDMYITAFDKWPELKTVYETEFRALLEKSNEYLLTHNKVGDIFYNFERSLECYPGNIFLLNDIGRYLYKFGYFREACCHFQKALNVNIGYVSAEKNMNSVKNVMVERWHYRMINDKERNNAYRRALHEVIRPMKETILDLGANAGLLALYCNECYPMMITTCDDSETMIEVAGQVLEENHVEDIILVSKPSTTLNFCDIGGKRSLVVTELFDAGLFGERILQTLEHAWNHLMSKKSRVLPSRAEFFVVGANCKFLNTRYRLQKPALKILETKSLNVHVASSDPYDTADVFLYEDFKYVTEPQSLLKINFNSLDDIVEKLKSTKPYDVTLKAKVNDEINIIIGWFNLFLTERIDLTSNPTYQYKSDAWPQAIFFDLIPRPVKLNDETQFQFTTYGGKISLIQDANDAIDRVSPEMIRFLNDTEYMRVITTNIGAIFIYLCQIVEVSHLNALDLCPFPLVGLMLMKRGAQSLTCYARTLDDKDFILKVFRENNIPDANITIILDEELSTDYFTDDQKYHLIFCNILELCGDLDVKQKEVMKKLKVSHLATGGLVMPFKITLEGQLVYSEWLETNNLADDKNVPDFRVAKYMNKYQVSQNFNLDIAHLEYTPFTEVTTIATCTDDIPPKVVRMKGTAEGMVNSVLCWYSVQLIELGEVLSTKRANSFVDSMAFRAHPKILMMEGKVAGMLRCVDDDDSFKLLTDIE